MSNVSDAERGSREPEDGRGVDAPRRRDARPDRHAVDGQRAEPLRRSPPCVRRPRSTGDDDHQVRPRGRVAHRRGDRGGSSDTMSERHASQPAASACATSISEFVSRITPAAGSRRPADLVAGRQHCDDRARTRGTSVAPAGRRGGDSRPPQVRCRRAQQLRGADVSPIERTCWYGATAPRSSARRRRRSGRTRASTTASTPAQRRRATTTYCPAHQTGVLSLAPIVSAARRRCRPSPTRRRGRRARRHTGSAVTRRPDASWTPPHRVDPPGQPAAAHAALQAASASAAGTSR